MSGPIIPHTREALWQLLRSDPERVESGLRVFETDIVCGEDSRVDAFARDAAGDLVSIFLAPGDKALVGRIVETQSWLTRHRELLGELLNPGLFADDEGRSRGLRSLVLGYRFAESLLDQLHGLHIDGLEVLEVDTLSVGGELRTAVRRVLGAEPALEALPVGPRADSDRLQAQQFLDLLRRLEPDQWVRGDRYRRSVYTGSGLLGELRVRGARFAGRSPCGLERELTGDQESAEVLDAILRYHVARAGSSDPPSSAQGPPAAATPRARTDEPSAPATRVGPEPGYRRLMSLAEVSQEEFDAISDLEAQEASGEEPS